MTNNLTRKPDLAGAEDLRCLEELVRDLEGGSGTPNGLMREHLDAARFYLVGAMPQEYDLSLSLAQDLLPTVENPSMQTRIADFLQRQESRTASNSSTGLGQTDAR